MSVDLAILGDPSNTKSSLSVNNTAATGAYKLAQRVIIVLLTDITQDTNLGVGTNIPGILRGSNQRDVEELRNFFSIASNRVRSVLANTTALGEPLDEILAELTFDFTVNEDEMDIRAVITTAAGTSVTVPVPVPEIAPVEESA